MVSIRFTSKLSFLVVFDQNIYTSNDKIKMVLTFSSDTVLSLAVDIIELLFVEHMNGCI